MASGQTAPDFVIDMRHLELNKLILLKDIKKFEVFLLCYLERNLYKALSWVNRNDGLFRVKHCFFNDQDGMCRDLVYAWIDFADLKGKKYSSVHFSNFFGDIQRVENLDVKNIHNQHFVIRFSNWESSKLEKIEFCGNYTPFYYQLSDDLSVTSFITSRDHEYIKTVDFLVSGAENLIYPQTIRLVDRFANKISLKLSLPHMELIDSPQLKKQHSPSLENRELGKINEILCAFESYLHQYELQDYSSFFDRYQFFIKMIKTNPAFHVNTNEDHSLSCDLKNWGLSDVKLVSRLLKDRVFTHPWLIRSFDSDDFELGLCSSFTDTIKVTADDTSLKENQSPPLFDENQSPPQLLTSQRNTSPIPDIEPSSTLIIDHSQTEGSNETQHSTAVPTNADTLKISVSLFPTFEMPTNDNQTSSNTSQNDKQVKSKKNKKKNKQNRTQANLPKYPYQNFERQHVNRPQSLPIPILNGSQNVPIPVNGLVHGEDLCLGSNIVNTYNYNYPPPGSGGLDLPPPISTNNDNINPLLVKPVVTGAYESFCQISQDCNQLLIKIPNHCIFPSICSKCGTANFNLN